MRPAFHGKVIAMLDWKTSNEPDGLKAGGQEKTGITALKWQVVRIFLLKYLIYHAHYQLANVNKNDFLSFPLPRNASSEYWLRL